MIRNKGKVRMAFIAARTEYVKWITNPRVIIVFMLIVVIRSLAIEPLLERAAKMGQPMNVLEPLVAVGNSRVLLMFMPAVFLAIMSDYPVIEPNSLIYVMRMGRKSWYFGQVIFALMSTVTYIAVVLVSGGLLSLSNSYFGLNWSESTRKYIFTFPRDADSFAVELLPPNLYNQINLGKTLIYTFTLLCLYLILLAMILLFFHMIKKRAFGIFAAYAVVAAGAVTCFIKSNAMWFLPMGNSIIWLHYTEILREPIQPIWYSYCYFAVLILLFIAGGFVFVNKMDFDKAGDIL